MQTLYQNALRFAAEKHSEQKVPGTNLSYVVHLSNVAMEIFIAAMNTEGFNLPLSAQVALLHDTLEDTSTTYDELLNQFGKEVADGVLALTKDHTLRKELQMQDSLERIRKQPKEVWAVKLADRITNLQPPPAHWSVEKQQQYQSEAKTIHRELKDGNQYLADRLCEKIEVYSVFVQGNIIKEGNDKNNTDTQFVKNFIRLIAEVKQQDPLTVAREMNRRSDEMMKRQQNTQDKPKE